MMPIVNARNILRIHNVQYAKQLLLRDDGCGKTWKKYQVRSFVQPVAGLRIITQPE
jgi:hypothetical protein